jgi:ATP-dependent Clp protease ATP-binding subunit ClpA
MFERYTEKARRVIFFARFEASQFGGSQIEPEHILLGMIREDRRLINRFFPGRKIDIGMIRRMIEEKAPSRCAASIDLPLSDEAKLMLGYAAEESEMLRNRHIGTEHLLLGLLRVGDSLAAKILLELGLQISEVRAAIAREAATQQQSEQLIFWHKTQRAEIDEKWIDGLLNTCFEQEVFTKVDFMNEFKRVAALRQFPVSTEAILRLLAEKGLADLDRLLELAFDFREENKLAEFIEKLKKFGAGG